MESVKENGGISVEALTIDYEKLIAECRERAEKAKARADKADYFFHMKCAEAIKILRKRTLMVAHPKDVGERPCDEDNPDILYCQRCKSGEYLHNEDGARNNYCGQCGQAIDWPAVDELIRAGGEK